MTLFVWWAVAPFYHGLFLYHEMFHHMSHEKKTSYFPLYWLINRDPYNGLS